MKYSLIKNSQGLTLLELLITLGIIVILASIAVPSYNTFMANERFAVASNELNNAYRFARNEAIKTSTSMTLEATSVDGDGFWREWQVKNSSAAVLFVSKRAHSTIDISGAALTVRGIGSLAGGSNVSFTISSASKTSLLCIYGSGQSVLRYPEPGEVCP